MRADFGARKVVFCRFGGDEHPLRGKIITLACAGAPASGVATPIVGDETDPPAISGLYTESLARNTLHKP